CTASARTSGVTPTIRPVIWCGSPSTPTGYRGGRCRRYGWRWHLADGPTREQAVRYPKHGMLRRWYWWARCVGLAAIKDETRFRALLEGYNAMQVASGACHLRKKLLALQDCIASLPAKRFMCISDGDQNRRRRGKQITSRPSL